jgi:predicted component of type VI protein secretion system
LIVAELVGNTHFERSLRLVISFGSLKRSQFLNALEERLKPELAKVCENSSTLAGKQVNMSRYVRIKPEQAKVCVHHA